MKVFLDDIRFAPPKYDKVFRTGEEFLEWLDEEGEVTIDLLSLDHDLGEGLLSGSEVVTRLLYNPLLTIKRVQIHSDNIKGSKNMYSKFSSAYRAGECPGLIHLNPYKISTIDGVETQTGIVIR